MKNWTEYELGILLSYEQPTQYIVESTDYDDSYDTPVLTAGKSFILGYTNENYGIYKSLPVIIFDDFTTASQYVNFPFKVKSSAMKILTPNKELVLPKFIYYRMQIIEFDHSTHKRYWIQQYSKIRVSIPTIPEQERIVARIEELFSELDNGVETLRKTKQQLAVYRQAVLETAFRECASKENVQFGDILSKKPRNGYSPKGVDYQTKYRNLTLTATTSGYFRDNCFKYVDIDIDDDSYLWVKHNDILIQRANTIEYVGTAVLYQGEDNRYVYPDLMMKCHTKDGINPQFVVYQLQSRVCKTHFREHATGTSGSMPKINQQTVMTAPIVMTSLDEQERIVKLIGERLSVCDSIEKTVDTALQQTEAMRQSILKQAFDVG